VARIRTIKPDFFFDEKLAEVDHKTRLAFIGLWCYADREGRLEDQPKVLKAKVFPYENIDFDKILESLSGLGTIVRYTVKDKKYLLINNFTKHQRPHHTERESLLPDFNGELTVKQPTQDGEARVGREGKGREGSTPPPKIFTPSENIKKWCDENNVSPEQAKSHAEKCYDYYRGKGKHMKDWEAVLRNWIRKDKEFNPERKNERVWK